MKTVTKAYQPPISTLLPAPARKLLVAASKSPEVDRHVHVDHAIDQVKTQYPQFFK